MGAPIEKSQGLFEISIFFIIVSTKKNVCKSYIKMRIAGLSLACYTCIACYILQHDS